MFYFFVNPMIKLLYCRYSSKKVFYTILTLVVWSLGVSFHGMTTIQDIKIVYEEKLCFALFLLGDTFNKIGYA